MNSQIRRILWTAFGALFLLTIVSTSVNVMVLQSERKNQYRTSEVYEPLLKALMSMDASISAMLAASRGYSLTQGRTEFLEQYTQAIREFETTALEARELAVDEKDAQLVSDITLHFQQLRRISDEQIDATDRGGPAVERMLDAMRVRRTAADFAGTFVVNEATRRAAYRQQLDNLRLFQTVTLVASVFLIGALGVFLIFRVERSIHEAVEGQLKKTRAMIGSMSEGIMLVDSRGRSEYINPAGERMLGTRETGVPIEEHSRVYGFRDAQGDLMSEGGLPAVEALTTGQEIRDVPVSIQKGTDPIRMVSMSATPIVEDGARGALVTFRDITERYKLEAEMQVQAERAQTLADAGAFFSSNIDLDWVTQAIAERVAEVLGDWAAVILKVPGTNEMRVAAIHHCDMSSLGLAWAFIYRQPLVVGEGTFGQPVATGVPSLVTSMDSGSRSRQEGPYHPSGSLASLLVMPLRTRGEIIGALAIAATNPENQMNEQKLPLTEVLAERAAVAIENARLYIEQVDARKKVEDLSRLKDEFLSIASHELRTPVTSIKGYTQLAKTMINEKDVENSVEYLDVALDQIDRMSRLILELLDVSRIETGRLDISRRELNWKEFVEEVVERQRMTKPDRQINLEIPDTDVMIRGDVDRLEQVLGNLIENAVKYSDQSKPVRVTVEDDHDGVLTTVRDEGMGIPADEINNVFERFHRGRQVSSTNYGGLGLGLYITKQIIDRHEGTIWVESEEGKGTIFGFKLPVSEVSAEASTA